MDFKFDVGDKVRIRGDETDFTDHMDGKIGTVIERMEDSDFPSGAIDYKVFVPGVPSVRGWWFIWERNMEKVNEGEDA